VVVTSRSGQKHQDQARQLGANEYVTKPFTAQTLGAAIKKWGSRSAVPTRSSEATLEEPLP
jgi:DNA-binding response OmpR family regulator